MRELIKGDCLKVLAGLPDGSIDAVITDPPYCSGGAQFSQRQGTPEKKYQVDGTKKAYPTFYGDSKDARVAMIWAQMWLEELFRVLRKDSFIMLFTDWRQIPLFSDLMQMCNFTWRGIVVWDKTENARPIWGSFKHQCEYVIYGTKGGMPDTEKKAHMGCFRIAVNPREKYHLTGKPIELMRELVSVVPKGGTILDPFAGSGTTLVAAKELGYDYIGIEQEQAYVDIANTRLTQVIPFENAV